MYILAVDSSSEILSVCINKDNMCLGEYTIKNLKTHSPKILPMIDELLKNCDLTINDIDLFACSIGPGSFTGLRIGLSVLKSMAQALNKPIIGVETLLSLANNVTENNQEYLICPILDAKNNNVYSCLFDKKYNLVVDYSALTINELINICQKQTKPIYFVGNGAIIYRELIEKKIKEKNIFGIINSELNSKNIAIGAYNKYLNNNTDDLYNLAPMYLKSSSAERVLKNEK